MGQTPDLEKALPQVNGRGSWTMTGNLLGMIDSLVKTRFEQVPAI